jgi:protein-disulfide isomerase
MSKRQEIREKRQKQERSQRIKIAAVLAVIAVAVVGWVIWLQRPVEGIVEVTPVARPQVNFNATGDPNAPVKIVEYGDFQCPRCRDFWQDTEEKFIDEYVKTGKVYFEYRSMDNFIGPESRRAAEAAYCAGDQQKFWEMHDILFANQGAENSGAMDDKHLRAFATTLGLDMAQFDSCLGGILGGKYGGRVSQDEADGTAAGIKATPSFLVNGKLLEGAQSFAAFQLEIDAALAAAGQ